jgi:hypothetical protein
MKRLSLLGFMVLATALGAFPQTGQISGVVTDQSGAVVPQAEITVINKDQRVERAAKSNESGYYAVPLLSPGNYIVTAKAEGFQTLSRDGVKLDATEAARIDFQLQVGSSMQQVTVSGAALRVDTERTEMGEVITGSQMVGLPLNGRAFTDLLALQPGVVPAPAQWYASPAASGELNPGNLSVSGQRGSENGFIVNGANVNEASANGTAVVPNLDSIAEFRIQTSNFDAAYGNYSGGLVNVVTKSGTNQFHGDVFEFLRNPNLDARNFYSASRATLHRNQFGGTIGGPIRRDKVFFFADYQGTREVQGLYSGLIPVPSAADRTGNLADLSSHLTGTVPGPFFANMLSQDLGYPVSIGEPYYASGCTTSSQCVFPGAVIPPSAIATPAADLMQYIPVSNTPGGYFSTSAYPLTLRDDKWSYRTDANTRWGMLSAYYHFDDYYELNPYAEGNLPGTTSAAVPGRAQLLNLADTKSMGPSMVNELHLNYMRMYLNSGLPVGGIGPSLSSFGIVTGPGGVVVLTPNIEGVPPVNFNSYAFGVYSSEKYRYQSTYQLTDNVAKVYGSHNARFGGDFHSSNVNTYQRETGNGQWYFNGGVTGWDFADYLLGAVDSFQQGEQFPQYMNSHYAALYAQDSWRARRGLTINYGLRWDLSTPWAEKHNETETLVFGEQSKAFPYAPTGWLVPGDPTVPHTVSPIRYHDFGPRIGVAYSPGAAEGISHWLFGGPGKSSVRASWGIFYTAYESGEYFWTVGDAPYGNFYSSPPTVFATPFINLSDGRNNGQRFPTPQPPLNVSPSNPDTSLTAAEWKQWYEPITGSPGVDHTNRTPYSENTMFSLERQFGDNTLLSLSYAAAEDHHLLVSLPTNSGVQSLCLGLSQASEVMPGTSLCTPNGENGVYYPITGGVVNSTRAPFGPAFGPSNVLFAAMANSNYNAFMASLRHSTGRAQFLLGYTYSKAMDNGSSWGQDDINPLNFKASKSLATFDMTHNFVASYSWQLPFDKLLRANRATQGWILEGITHFTTGLPVELMESDDNSLLGIGNQGVDVPNITPGKILADTNPRDAQPYVNIALFSREPLGSVGNANRRFFHGPGLNSWDLALLKNLKLTESMSLQFRGEFFSAFNHAQFNTPDGNINDGTFGMVTSAVGQRIGQVAMKLLF